MFTFDAFSKLIQFSLLLLALSFISGCGNDRSSVINVDQTDNSPSDDIGALSGDQIAGYYTCGNKSYIELLTDDLGRLTLDQISLNSVNPQNNSIGTHPNPSIRDQHLRFIDGVTVLRLPASNVNYTSGHDIEEDTSGANITGQRRTDIIFVFETESFFRIFISIWDNPLNNNINEVVADRVIECSR